MIRIETRQTGVRAGETIGGQAVWNSDGGKQPRKISVGLRWVVSCRGEQRKNVIEEKTEADIGERSVVPIPFNFHVPASGPLTYQGNLFSIEWEIFASADLPFASDEKEAATFVVGPSIWNAEQFRAFVDSNDDVRERL